MASPIGVVQSPDTAERPLQGPSSCSGHAQGGPDGPLRDRPGPTGGVLDLERGWFGPLQRPPGPLDPSSAPRRAPRSPPGEGWSAPGPRRVVELDRESAQLTPLHASSCSKLYRYNLNLPPRTRQLAEGSVRRGPGRLSRAISDVNTVVHRRAQRCATPCRGDVRRTRPGIGGVYATHSRAGPMSASIPRRIDRTCDDTSTCVGCVQACSGVYIAA